VFEIFLTSSWLTSERSFTAKMKSSQKRPESNGTWSFVKTEVFCEFSQSSISSLFVKNSVRAKVPRVAGVVTYVKLVVVH
jgi:hypothetical protein